MVKTAKQNLPQPQHFIDHLTDEYGNQVLRLPSYNCDLNPIELIWVTLKLLLKKRNLTFKMKDSRPQIFHGIQAIGGKNLVGACNQVLKIEQSHWKTDKIIDNYNDELLGEVIKQKVSSDTELDDSDDENRISYLKYTLLRQSFFPSESISKESQTCTAQVVVFRSRRKSIQMIIEKVDNRSIIMVTIKSCSKGKREREGMEFSRN